jgi:ABC-2 type transport system ATP-binding protein
MILVERLVKLFGRTRAVDDISFAVQKGEVVGFLGPNGAGKTTTLRVLTCWHPATSGRALVSGHDVQDDPVAVRRQIGYLPENVPIYPDLRVEEYLHYRAALKGVPRRLRRAHVESAMERCGVVEVRRKLVGHVSRGYRQRVGLADALVSRPPILILDEPTSGLDPNQRRRMKTLVRELAAEHTILFSSHILSEVQDVATRILVIHRGQIRADGTTERLLQHGRGRHLVVSAAVPGAQLAELLADVPGISGSRVLASDGEFTTVEATVTGDGEVRDAAFAALVARGARVRELRLALPTLEDVFEQLTEGQDLEGAARTEAIAS